MKNTIMLLKNRLIRKIILCIIFLPFLFRVFSANADVWVEFPQVVCISEMDYFYAKNLSLEDTNNAFDAGYPEDAYKKHGILMEPSVKKAQCKVNDGIIEYELEFFPNPMHTVRGCSGTDLYPGSHLKLWFITEDKKILLFDDTFSWHCNLYGAELSSIYYHSDIFSFTWTDDEDGEFKYFGYSDYISDNFETLKNDCLQKAIDSFWKKLRSKRP